MAELGRFKSEQNRAVALSNLLLDGPERVRAWAAKTPRCKFCRGRALKGFEWCQHHGPRGPDSRQCDRVRKPGDPRHMPNLSRPGFGERLRRGRQEKSAQDFLPPELADWPPIARLITSNDGVPSRRRFFGVRHVVAALLAHAAGHPTAWHDASLRLRDAGWWLSGDPPPPTVHTLSPNLAGDFK